MVQCSDSRANSGLGGLQTQPDRVTFPTQVRFCDGRLAVEDRF